MDLRSGTAANILYQHCAVFGLPVNHGWERLSGKIREECIVIARHGMDDDTYWNTCFVEVNFLIPDTESGGENKLRLDELEDSVRSVLKGAGIFNGRSYTFECISTGQEREPDLNCHYVNAKIKFDVLNVN